MNKPRISLFLLLAFIAGFALNRYAVAQSSRVSNTAGDVTLQRFERLVTDLTVRGDTNTLAQVRGLLDAKDTLNQTKDASMAVALLQRLRSGRTNEVMEVLEIQLDGALTGLGIYPNEIGESQLETLELAKQYRTKYPRKQTAGVTKAFELLDKR